MSKIVRTFAAVMANTNNNQQTNPNVNWHLILKIAIAVLTALAGAIGVSKSEAVADMVDGIVNKEATR